METCKYDENDNNDDNGGKSFNVDRVFNSKVHLVHNSFNATAYTADDAIFKK